MSAPKRTKRGRAKRDINDTATELSKTGKVDCLEALLGISIEQYESEQTEEETIRHKKLDDRVEAIRKNPEVFFSLDGGFGDEEICAVRTALQGKNWNEIFLLAVDAEQQKLMNLGYSPAQADALVQPGWAWRYEQTMIVARQGSILANLKPLQCIEMVLVHKGFRWEAPGTLDSLARIELRIPSPTEIGNASGSYLASRTASIRRMASFASFIATEHPEELLQQHAQELIGHCSGLLALIEKDGDLRLVSEAMNVASLNTFLRIMMDSQMLDANRRQHAFYKNAKPDPSGVRAAVKTALLAVFNRVKRKPQKQEVLDELKPIPSDDGMIHLMQEILTHREFDKILEGIRKTEKWRWQKGPQVPRGRPRKES
jgi:hypothetical protein